MQNTYGRATIIVLSAWHGILKYMLLFFLQEVYTKTPVTFFSQNSSFIALPHFLNFQTSYSFKMIFLFCSVVYAAFGFAWIKKLLENDDGDVQEKQIFY